MSLDTAAFKFEISTKPLNDLLDQLEVEFAHLGQGTAEQAQKMLLKMDAAYHRVREMTEKELPVRAEAAQLEYLTAGLEHNAKGFIRQIGGQAAFAQMRAVEAPTLNQRWWYLDEFYHRQVRKSTRTFLLTSGAVVLALLILILVYNTFLAPDPIVTQVYSYQNNAEKALQSQDLNTALSETSKALALTPNDPSLLIMRGVIEEKLNQTDLASKDYAAAETNLGNHNSFLLGRSQTWIQVGDTQKGLADARQVVESDPANAEGFYYFGKANELLQNYGEAIAAYQKASELADSQGKQELNAVIRMNLAMLMQSIPIPTPNLTPQPTPIPAN